MEKWLQHGAKPLPPLHGGDTVVVQDLTKKGQPGRWTKSGIIVEVLPHDAYLVKVHGSRALTKRNRRFLRKISPFMPASPVLSGESHAVPPMHIQPSAAPTASPEVPIQNEVIPPPPEYPLSVSPPLPAVATVPHQDVPVQKESQTAYSLFRPQGPTDQTTYQTHRLSPAASPGQTNILEVLKQREKAGLHLAMEMDWRALYH